jgi:hypothetical protein
LVDLEDVEEQLCEGVNFLVKDYLSDISITLAGEMKEFPCLYQAKLFR